MKKIILVTTISLFFIAFTYSQNVKNYIVYKTDSKFINDFCFTNSGATLLATDNNTIKVFAVTTGVLQAEFKKGTPSPILTLDLSGDSTLLACGDKAGTITLWNYISRERLKVMSQNTSPITTLQISPDRQYLVWGGTDRKVYLYDIEKDQIVHEFTGFQDDITSVKISPDGKLLAVASADRTIKLYSLTSKTLVANLTAHRNWVREVSFSKDSKTLVSTGDDAFIIKWNLTDKNNIQIISRERIISGWLLSIAFYNIDAKTYVFGSINGRTRIVIDKNTSYSARVGVPINKVKFQPNQSIYLKIAMATRGKGMIFMNSLDMH